MGVLMKLRLLSLLAVTAFIVACSDDPEPGKDTFTGDPDTTDTDAGDVAADDSVDTDTKPAEDIIDDEDVVDDADAQDIADDEDVVDDEGLAEDKVEPTDPASARPDADWSTLPTLPQGKNFTTRYAAGVARVDVSPKNPINLSGYGNCTGNADICRFALGVHDPLYATAVAFADPQNEEVVVFVGFDGVGIFPFDADVIQARVQTRMYEEKGLYFQGERLIPVATHSHAGPDTTGLWGDMMDPDNVRDEEYISILREGIVEAAIQAIDDLGDVELAWTKTSLENRTNDYFNTDYDMYIIQGKRPDADTLFTMVRWAAHPTVYGSDNVAVSADWVGPFRKKIDEATGALSVYLQGPIGGVYPINRPEECGLEEEAFPDGYKYENPKEPGNMDVQRMKVTCTGYLIAQSVLDALEGELTPVADTGIEFNYKDFEFHAENELFSLVLQIAPTIPLPPINSADPNSKIWEEVEWVKLGDLNFLTSPGESFPTFAKKGADILLEAGYTNPIVMGMSPNWIGYLLVKEHWELDQEVIDANKLDYNMGLSPGKYLDEAYTAAIQAMVDERAQ